MARVKINVEIEGEKIELNRNEKNILEFAEASLPSGSTLKAKAVDAGFNTVLLHLEFSDTIEPRDIPIIGEYVKRRLQAIINKFGNPKLLGLSGRMPLWLASSLTHELVHLVPSIGLFDPKQGGIVVVASHSKVFSEGEVVKVPQEIVSLLLS